MTRRRQNSPKSMMLSCETLEKRELLHGRSIVWSELPQLTLSFAPDGADIAGEQNVLNESMDAQLLGDEWQETILRAFQTWAVHTNANIGVVAEDGLYEFGTPGPRTGDERFGDIRIGARSLSNNVAAVAIEHDTVVSGTWAGDVIFNSDFEFESLEQLFSVTLHEAGHVFGLPRSDNSDSPMHDDGHPTATELLREDIRNLTDIYGDRKRDSFEDRDGNERIFTATRLPLNRVEASDPGSAPTVIFADLTYHHDVDFYRIDMPRHYSGPVTVRAMTGGISLMDPSLAIYDERGQLLIHSPSQESDVVELTVETSSRRIFVKVHSTQKDVFGIGAYSLTISFDAIDEVASSIVDRLSGNRFFGLDSDAIGSFFRDGNRRWIREDRHSNDRSDMAGLLNRSHHTSEFVNLKTLGSISDSKDVDFYRFDSPGRHFSDETTTYISVRSLDEGNLIPKLKIFHQDRRPVESESLVNGNGELIVQVPKVVGETSFVIALSSASHLANFQQGNYELNVFFMKQATEITTYIDGELESQSLSKKFYIAKPQLFHFALQVDGENSFAGAMVRIINENSELIHQIVAPEGEIRTAGSTLLLPGEYVVQAIPLRLSNSPVETIRFDLSGAVISDPFGIDPVLPDETEYGCDGVDDVYCYPNETESTLAYDWEDFWTAIEQLELEPAEVSDALFAEWWTVFWLSEDVTDPPVGLSEDYSTDVDGTLDIPAANGVLSNDVTDAELLLSTISRIPTNGQLQLAVDGSFIYIPNPGFSGVDSFDYIASDFRNQSTATTVRISVGADFVEGDLTGDGIVSVDDIDQHTQGVIQGIDQRFDLNSDGFIDADDRAHLVKNILGTNFGDSDLDGLFGTSDLVRVFQFGLYEEDTHSTWAQGDWNGDGRFSTADLVFVFQAGGFEVNAAVAVLALDLESDSKKKLFSRL